MYHFFYGGPLSQWYPSDFIIEGKKFNTAEQFMMYSKAILFNDDFIAHKIRTTDDPHKQKALGRMVKNFDKQKWNLVAREIVYIGNYAKFTQNHEVLKYLLDIKEKLIVEASPYDKIWGIGLDEVSAAKTPKSQWKGKNWLGVVLTRVRDSLKEVPY